MTTRASWWKCVGFLVAAVALPGAAGAAEKWVRVESGGVTVYSEASVEDATQFLVNYLGYRHTFTTLFGRADRPLGPVHVLLFRKQKSLGKISGDVEGASKVAVALTSMADGDVILGLSLDSDRQNALRIIYEFDTICGLKRSGYFLPLWMEQGTGAVLSTLAMEKDACVVGASFSAMAGTLGNDKWLPWEKVSAARPNSTTYNTPATFQLFAAQSWGLMRLVLQSDPGRARERFLGLVEEVRRTPQADLAAAKVLQLEPAAVREAIFRQVRRTDVISVPFDRGQARTRIKADAAPGVEVAVAIASLTLTHGSRAAADIELQRAIALAPESPMVLEAMARRETKNNDKNRAAEYYRAAIAAGTTNPRAYILSAQRRLDDAMGGGNDQPGQGGLAVVDALAEIRQALKLNPGDGEAYYLLGRALYVSESVSADDLAGLAPGLDSPDYGFLVRLYHALIELRLDQYAVALGQLRDLLRDTTVAPEKRQAALHDFAAQNFGLVRVRVESLVRARDFAAARMLLDERLNPTEWEVIAQPVQALHEWVKVSAALAELEELEATGSPEELRKARQAFIAQYPDQPATAQLQAILEAESSLGK